MLLEFDHGEIALRDQRGSKEAQVLFQILQSMSHLGVQATMPMPNESTMIPFLALSMPVLVDLLQIREAPPAIAADPDFLPRIATQIVGAFVGAICAFVFAIWLARRNRRNETSLAMIVEFSSSDMLKTRYIVHNIRSRINGGGLSLREVTLSSVQGCPTGFQGDVVHGLTEHQHISNITGWYRRLSIMLQKRAVDHKLIVATLGGSFGWSLPLLVDMANEAESLMAEFPSERPLHLRASWIYAIRHVDNIVNAKRVAKLTPSGRIRRIHR